MTEMTILDLMNKALNETAPQTKEQETFDSVTTGTALMEELLEYGDSFILSEQQVKEIGSTSLYVATCVPGVGLSSDREAVITEIYNTALEIAIETAYRLGLKTAEEQQKQK